MFKNDSPFDSRLTTIKFDPCSIHARPRDFTWVLRRDVGQQRELERNSIHFWQANNLRDWLKRLSARPHHLWSPEYDRENVNS